MTRIRQWQGALRCALMGLAALAASSVQAGALDLDTIFADRIFAHPVMQDVHWADDGASFVFTRPASNGSGPESVRHTVSDGRETVLISAADLQRDGKSIGATRMQWTAPGDRVLITGPVTRTWDNVFEAPHYVYESGSKRLRVLADGKPLRAVSLSPDGTQVGYVIDNNLYLAALADGSARAVTSDGSADIFNGIFDYGSRMFGGTQAWHWSPDSQRVAFWRMDATEVRVFHLIDELPADGYNIVRELKYPNAGQVHAAGRIGVFDLGSGETRWLETGDNPDDYLVNLTWAPDAQSLLVQRLSRNHQRLDVLEADVDSGRSRVVLTDTDPAWLDLTDDLRFIGSGDAFVWTSEKSGFRHIYRVQRDGVQAALTQGDWEVTRVIDVDEQGGWVYFSAKIDSYIDEPVYRVPLAGGEVQRVSAAAGWHQWELAPGGRHVIARFSDANTPQHIALLDADGVTLRELARASSGGVDIAALPKTEFVQVPTDDGTLVDAFIIKPVDFDPSRKYPVITYGYGNAGSQVVVNRWGTQRGPAQDLWHRYFAEQGYIVIGLDNRTTTGRGKAAKNLTYRYYGKYATTDHLEAMAHIKTWPYIDGDRLGFWGWSGGGYLAAALMTKGAGMFSTAVSVAPVIDLVRYQAVGVERWMNTPKENPEGYAFVNLINDAHLLEGNLLLIHGTGDDNVKFGFTLQFADALIKQNKDFDMLVYPNEHHGIEGAQRHVFGQITRYFRLHL